jgi:hypothetical protein
MKHYLILHHNNKVKAFLSAYTRDMKDQSDSELAKRIDRLIQKQIHFADLREMINKVWET